VDVKEVSFRVAQWPSVEEQTIFSDRSEPELAFDGFDLLLTNCPEDRSTVTHGELRARKNDDSEEP
jgi:hypothetical protein